MLEGSLLAGMAFCNAGVTAVHAFAYPIGAEFHILHGVANNPRELSQKDAEEIYRRVL